MYINVYIMTKIFLNHLFYFYTCQLIRVTPPCPLLPVTSPIPPQTTVMNQRVNLAALMLGLLLTTAVICSSSDGTDTSDIEAINVYDNPADETYNIRDGAVKLVLIVIIL